MSAAKTCSKCGTALGADALEGVCPRCLMALNLATQTDAPTGDLGPEGTRVVKPPPEAPPSVAEVARHFPQLEILEYLGRGGMGVVYKARQPRLDRLVALKILAKGREGDPLFAERFLREARALARLNHPNIVAVYDFGETEGHYFLLMEYVDGLNLRQLLRARKVAPPEALTIVPKICEALQYAHEQGIVHRDIKPENILLDKQGRVKIADFGLAKLLGVAPQRERLTESNQVMGTPHYMAPEQTEHPMEVDHRADIYSLGVVFYEMLTGELPLGRFAPPSRKVQVDVRLDEVVLRALEKEPARRYQQASQVKSDVETISRSEAPVAGRSPAPAAVSEGTRRLFTVYLVYAIYGAAVLAALLPFIVLVIDFEDPKHLERFVLFLPLAVGLGLAGKLYSLLSRVFFLWLEQKLRVAGPWSSAPGSETILRMAGPAPEEQPTQGGQGNAGEGSPPAQPAEGAGAPPGDPTGTFSSSLLPELEPGERVVYVQKRLWSFWAVSPPTYKWFFSLPPLVSAGLYVTDRRILLVAHIFSVGTQQSSIWFPGKAQGPELLKTVSTGRSRWFGNFLELRSEMAGKHWLRSRELRLRFYLRNPGSLQQAIAGAMRSDCGGSGAPAAPSGNPAPSPGSPTSPNPPAPPAPPTLTVVRWTARVLGTLLFLFLGIFIVAEGTPPVPSQPAEVQIEFAAMLLILLGCLVGWKREGWAALLSLAGWGVFHLIEPSFRLGAWDIAGLVGALYAACWWMAARGRSTGGAAPGRRKLLGSILVALIVAVGLRAFVLAPYRAQTDAARPAITAGSYVFVFKLARSYAPGDLVVYRLDGNNMLGRVAQAGPKDGVLMIEHRQQAPRPVPVSQVAGRVILNTRAGRPAEATRGGAQGATGSAPVPADDAQAAVRAVAQKFLAAIRERDDATLKALAFDSVPGWRNSVPLFAEEIRQALHTRDVQGEQLTDIQAVVVEGDWAAVQVAGPKEAGGIYLALLFTRTPDGWRNGLLKNSSPQTPLSKHLSDYMPKSGSRMNSTTHRSTP